MNAVEVFSGQVAIEHVFAELPTTARYADTENGRSLNHMTALGGGDRRILVAPASHRDLVTRLQEMYNSLSR